MPERKFDEFDVTVDEEPTFLQRLASRPWVVFVYYCVLIGYGILSVTFDWLWVNDMLNYETGLVFGPPDNATIAFLIIVASVGTLSFILEIVGVSLRIFKKKRLLDEDLAEVLTILLEEAPSITLNLLIARCREIPISFYQLAKAALEIFGAIFRLLGMLYHYFNTNKHKWAGAVPWALRTIITLVCVYNAVAACLVFVYTYTEPGGSFIVPDNILEKDYGGSRYFTNAGLFFTHPSMVHCNSSSEDFLPGWLQVDEIYNVTAQDRDTRLTFYTNDSAQWSVACVLDDKCYNITADCTILNISKPENRDEYDMVDLAFTNRPKSKSVVYGDILTAGAFYPAGSDECYQMTVDDWGFLTPDNSTFDPVGQLQYFKMVAGKNNTGNFYEEADGSLRLFLHEGDEGSRDMDNVTDVWLTGYRECDMTGRIAPSQGDMQICTT